MASQPDLSVISEAGKPTVRVRIIDTTSMVSNIPVAAFMAPVYPGLSTFAGPCYSFLIEHPSSSRSVLFDLGVRKDWRNLPPKIVNQLESMKMQVQVQKGVREQLEDHGVDAKAIEAIIWSHWHFDHTGDPSTFDPSTALVVGPGFKQAFVPGYPANPDAPILETDYQGRELREIVFDQGLKIGQFNAFDYFGDGSFYLLDSPGHAVGHLCGFARVTSSPSSFILMGGDICHHAGEFRPSSQCPLPAMISPSPFDRHSPTPCPGAMFERLLPNHDKTKPFFTVGEQVAHDAKEAQVSIGKLQDVDALDEVMVVIAHDAVLLDVLDFFPKYADHFVEKGWAKDSKWLFLKDFVEAVRAGYSST